MPRTAKFSDTEIAKYAVKHGVAKTCVKFGCSHSTVYNACRTKNVKPPTFTAIRSHEVVEWMAANKATIAEAAKHFQISGFTVRRYCQMLDHKPASAEYLVPVSLSNFEILAALLCGYTQAQVSDEFGVTRQRVQQIYAKGVDARLIGKRAIVQMKDNVPFDKKAGIYRP